MPLYADNVVDTHGAAIPGASVTVRTAAGALATITTAAGAALTNPFSADSGGQFSFVAAAGTYTLQITSGTHSKSKTIYLNDDVVMRPETFGAVQAIVNNLDASAPATVALQAFFDHAADPTNARRYIYDWTGTWAVDGPVYSAYPVDNDTRRFIDGSLHVLPVATPIDTVLTITGPYQDRKGMLRVSDGQNYTGVYTSRRFYTGVHIMQATESVIGPIHVRNARNKGVFIDSRQTSWTIRAGSPYQRTGTTRNNIGLQIESVFGEGVGSYTGTAASALVLTVSALSQGSDANQDGVFVAGTGGYGSSFIQRSRLTVASTAELSQYDFGKTRNEIFPATYTSIAADATAGTITWTAGDPVAAGLAVGSKFTLEDNNSVGLNDGVEYEVVSFGGTSNRTITVYPKPGTTETARVYSGLYTGWSMHLIMTVISSTQFMVFPWVQDTAALKWYSCHGFVTDVQGDDSANVQIGYVGGILTGSALRTSGLYNPKVGTLLNDNGEICYVNGLTPNSVNQGAVIGQIHAEGMTRDVIQVSSEGSQSLDIAGSSFLALSRCSRLTPRFAPSSALPLEGAFIGQAIAINGRAYLTNTHGAHAGDNNFSVGASGSALSNAPGANDANLFANSGSVDLDYDFDAGRVSGLAKARLFWVGPAGLAPSGTLTFALSAKLTQLGWAIVGTNPVSGLTKACRFEVLFEATSRKVFVQRFDAA